ncbi:MAG: nucleotidyltransferase domain-containing protein [Saprospiraceae bacterium]|nr:MAG: nucleotidyltransferase domain-containing protein [Saprospiraceae bacterium]
MKKSKEKILKAITLKLKTIAPDARVIRFGSRARGDAKPDLF